jgi:hypothetical protein
MSKKIVKELNIADSDRGLGREVLQQSQVSPRVPTCSLVE